ncbi:MAG: Hsp20 family protein [Gammaproteobacteria bacterium]|nr:Hsp20 family protein [Gammaproteobacteria bacterium]NNC98290.1 Hsp20 family protein [Gammaproteobacteria bacterium]NNM13608.1 Hsp20 family protein [Gammaproteobacteria bacterium]
MKTLDLSPLYRSSIGFDRLASLLDASLRSDQSSSGYPPYDIEVLDENQYAITLAVAGFERDELDLQLEKGVLSIRGKKHSEDAEERNFLHKGIAHRTFERKFNLADHVEVTGADLNNGLLTIQLFKRIPEAMKPRKIEIGSNPNVIEHPRNSEQAA